MLQEVSDAQLKELQTLHSNLIKEYEDIVKQKIDIFTDMITNLKVISVANIELIKNEEVFAEKRLAVEVWERDIY